MKSRKASKKCNNHNCKRRKGRIYNCSALPTALNGGGGGFLQKTDIKGTNRNRFTKMVWHPNKSLIDTAEDQVLLLRII